MLKVMELWRQDGRRGGRQNRRGEEAATYFQGDGHMIIPTSRRLHDGTGEELRLQSKKIWVQGVEANDQSLPPEHVQTRSVACSRVTHPVSVSGLTSMKRSSRGNA